MKRSNGPYDKIKAYYFRLLPELTEESWAQVAQLVTVRRLGKGEFFIRPGEVSNYVSFINYGMVRSYYVLEGREYVVGFFDEEHCYFSSYESFLTRQPSQLCFEALEETEVVDISYNDLQLMYDRIPGADRLGRIVAESLFITLSKKNASFLLETPEQRYRHLLQQRPSLFQKVPQYMIASYLGITPEALSRIRSRLSKKAATELIDSNQ